MLKAQTMRRIRQLHLYLGLFFAPMLLLFAISGALQVYRINEEKGYGGTPPAWMQWIAAIHKNQAAPREKAPGPKLSGPVAVSDHDEHDAPESAITASAAKSPAKPAGALLKIFAVFLAIALALSTLFGVIIALNARATRRIGIAMLVIGTILPIILLKL
jgi:uncharacterized iron-regulated membrane protein